MRPPRTSDSNLRSCCRSGSVSRFFLLVLTLSALSLCSIPREGEARNKSVHDEADNEAPVERDVSANDADAGADAALGGDGTFLVMRSPSTREAAQRASDRIARMMKGEEEGETGPSRMM